LIEVPDFTLWLKKDPFDTASALTFPSGEIRKGSLYEKIFGNNTHSKNVNVKILTCA
jgi:hypothetical protein